MHSLVDEYALAIETNNRELALSYIHPAAPTRQEIDAKLRGQLAAYMEKAKISQLEPVSQADGNPAARVDQELVRVFGLKILHSSRRSIFRFRALDDSWRIWGIDEIRRE
jgi:hypothetical protein